MRFAIASFEYQDDRPESGKTSGLCFGSIETNLLATITREKHHNVYRILSAGGFSPQQVFEADGAVGFGVAVFDDDRGVDGDVPVLALAARDRARGEICYGCSPLRMRRKSRFP